LPAQEWEANVKRATRESLPAGQRPGRRLDRAPWRLVWESSRLIQTGAAMGSVVPVHGTFVRSNARTVHGRGAAKRRERQLTKPAQS
jgi:hypothetical protein